MKEFSDFYFFLLFVLLSGGASAQARTDQFMIDLFAKNKNPVFQKVISNPAEYRLQIIYTQINRDRQNIPTFKEYYFNLDSTLYFNPASTVKLPAAILAMEKINRLKNPLVTIYTTMVFDSSYSSQTPMNHDSTSPTGKPNLAHFIRRAFLVSENEPYTRMYEFTGQQYFNRRLWKMGYTDTRIMHRFVRMTTDENRHTNAVSFIDSLGKTVYTQAAEYNRDSFTSRETEIFGKGYFTPTDSLVNQPFNFTNRNRISLSTLNNILKAVIFPRAMPSAQKFDLSESDLQFLRQYLSQYPRETNYPKFDGEKFYDSNVKFFFMDSAHQSMPEDFRAFNKAGWAYGFLTDVAYIADFKNKVEFLLSATVYVNSDGILNDGKYDYREIGHPFLYSLGQTIYQYELERKRKFKPDLNELKIRYDKRIEDNRPVISEADN